MNILQVGQTVGSSMPHLRAFDDERLFESVDAWSDGESFDTVTQRLIELVAQVVCSLMLRLHVNATLILSKSPMQQCAW